MAEKSPFVIAAQTVLPAMRRRSAGIKDAAASYELVTSREEIESYQLKAFNDSWDRASTHVPFYAQWKKQHSLPDKLGNVRELVDFPVVTKRVLQENETVVSQTPGISAWLSTGGSTGEPVSLPTGPGESLDRYVDNFIARKWAGVSPGDKYFHVWGHSHLFGNGVRRLKNTAIRSTKDRLLGVTRVSAYDQSMEAAWTYAKLIAAKNPVYVVGYTSSVLRIAAAITQSRYKWVKPSNLRSVTVTAETASPSDLELIELAFGVPCFVEYGAAETGVMACSTQGSSSLSVLWRSHLLWAEDDGELRVNSLRRRVFPLVNYALGDRVTTSGGCGPILKIRTLEGRSREAVDLLCEDDTLATVSCIAIVHSIKAVSPANSVQIAQLKSGVIAVGLTSFGPLDLAYIRSRVKTHLADSVGPISDQSIVIKQLTTPVTTSAGKVKVLLDSIDPFVDS